MKQFHFHGRGKSKRGTDPGRISIFPHYLDFSAPGHEFKFQERKFPSPRNRIASGCKFCRSFSLHIKKIVSLVFQKSLSLKYFDGEKLSFIADIILLLCRAFWYLIKP